MANYVLVENRQIIHLGPIPWRHRFIQSELDDLEVTYTVPPVEQGYIRINDNFEIFPVGEAMGDDGDSRWEDPVGPTWEYVDNQAIPTFGKQDKLLDQIRQFIKNDLAAKRYVKEAAGTQVEIRPGIMVTADTSRDGRNIFVQVYGTMADDSTVDWKFPEGWFTITKAELGDVIAGGYTYIQEQFVWEKTYSDRVDAAIDVGELKAIYDELNPAVVPGVV